MHINVSNQLSFVGERLFRVVEAVAEQTGYKNFVKAAKYIYAGLYIRICIEAYIYKLIYMFRLTNFYTYLHIWLGSTYLLKEIIDSDLLNILTPLMESMNHFGIR